MLYVLVLVFLYVVAHSSQTNDVHAVNICTKMTPGCMATADIEAYTLKPRPVNIALFSGDGNSARPYVSSRILSSRMCLTLYQANFYRVLEYVYLLRGTDLMHTTNSESH